MPNPHITFPKAKNMKTGKEMLEYMKNKRLEKVQKCGDRVRGVEKPPPREAVSNRVKSPTSRGDTKLIEFKHKNKNMKIRTSRIKAQLLTLNKPPGLNYLGLEREKAVANQYKPSSASKQ